MYTIKLVNTNTIIYDQSVPAVAPMLGPKCSLEVNEAGSLSFTLGPTHPQINNIEPLASYIRAYDDGTEIFYGRVISRSKPTLTGNVTFQCAGALSFLMDSEIPPYNKNANGQYEVKRLSAQDFFEWCIDKHNDEVDDSRRRFTVGTVNASRRNEVDEYSITNYTQTKSAIESHILSMYGGFIRTRTVNGTNYIDWLEDYPTLNPQTIAIGVNLQEQTNETDATSVFTVLRPVGQNGLTLSGSGTIDLYSSADMAKYGRIVKSVSFNSATTVADLQSKANDYKNRISKTLFESSNIHLVDMHYIDGTSPKIRLGDRFTNIIGYSGVTMIASAIDLDFEAPQNDTIDMKDRKSMDPDGTKEGHGHNSGNRSMSSHKGKSESQFFRWLKEQGDVLEVLAPTVNMHGDTLEQHYIAITQTAENYSRISSSVDDISGIVDEQRTKINDMDVVIQSIEGTAVFQNSQAIWDVAGQLELVKDTSNNILGVRLKNGSLIQQDENGQYVNVGQQLSQAYTAANDVNTLVRSEILGSALWTQRNRIVGVCGQYTVREEDVPDPDNPGQTKKKYTLIIESGGGLNIRRNGVEVGVWDQGNLTGGTMVQQINGQTTTKILGSKVDIEAKDIKLRATETLDSVVGHMRRRAIGPQLDGNGNQMYDPETGEPLVRYELVFEVDGGLRVKRDNGNGVSTEYGIYDNGNLTAGVICGKINGTNNETYTHIKGDKIVIGDDLDPQELPDWCSDTDGAIISKATIASLNAVKARVSTLETDYLKTNELSAAFSQLERVDIKKYIYGGEESFCNFTNYWGTHYYYSLPAGTVGSGSATVDLRGVHNCIKNISLTGPTNNVYTLTQTDYVNRTTTIGTFSRAVTQFDAGWSNGTYTVTAQPQNQSVSTKLLHLAPVGNVSKTGKVVNQTFKVQYGPDAQHLTDTGFQQVASISATDVYDDGYDAGYDDGWDEGYNVSWEDGYDDGYDAGYDVGEADGKNSVNIGGPLWDNGNKYYGDSNWTPSSRTIEFHTTGKKTNVSGYVWVGIYQNGSHVYLLENDWSGSRRAGISISDYHPNAGPKLIDAGTQQLYTYNSAINAYKAYQTSNTHWYYSLGNSGKQYYY